MAKKNQKHQPPKTSTKVVTTTPSTSNTKLEEAQLDLEKMNKEKLNSEEVQDLDLQPEPPDLKKEIANNDLVEAWHALKRLWNKAERQKERYETLNATLEAECTNLKEERKAYSEITALAAKLAVQRQELFQKEQEAINGFPSKLKTYIDKIEADLEAIRLKEEKLEAKEKEIDEEFEAKKVAWEAEVKDRKAKADQDVKTLKAQADLEANERQLFLKQEQARLNTLDFDLKTREHLLQEDREALKATANKLETAAIAKLNQELEIQKQIRADLEKQVKEKTRELLNEQNNLKELGHKSPKEITKELSELRKEIDRLQKELASSLSQEERARLDALQKDYDHLLQDHRLTKQAMEEYRLKYERVQIGATELESLHTKIKAQESQINLKAQMLADLQLEVDGYTKKNDARQSFHLCSDIDNSPILSKARNDAHDFQSLADLSTYLQHKIATVEGTRLFYSERMVRTFLAGLAIGKLTILQGISGTGKTSLPRAFAKAIGAAPKMRPGEKQSLDPVAIIEVQSGWRDRQDLIGYFNTFEGKYYETAFLAALYRAGTPRFMNTPFFIILDEMNLSHPEHYFADLLSLIENEPGSRSLRIVSDIKDKPSRFVKGDEGIMLPIPPNVWFIGTANHDETTLQFAPKTYDRANVMEMPIHPARFKAEDRKDLHLGYNELEVMFKQAAQNKKAEANAAQKFMDEDVKKHVEKFGIGWGNRLEKQLGLFVPVFLEAGGSIGDAIDHLIVSKVLRNIKNRYDIKREDLQELQGALSSAFEKNKYGVPDDSIKLINAEIHRIG